MKPVKILYPVAMWIMRFAILLVAFYRYFDVVKAMNFSSLSFYLGVAFILFSVLLFAAGLLSKASLTVVSALVLCVIVGFHIFAMAKGGIGIDFTLNLLLGSVLLLFVSKGNS
ncbi:MAG: hypothetical protein WC951_13030 [Bacteroidales bacterium]|nr:hypothetical protein [Tenuifilaceae bacterium]